MADDSAAIGGQLHSVVAAAAAAVAASTVAELSLNRLDVNKVELGLASVLC